MPSDEEVGEVGEVEESTAPVSGVMTAEQVQAMMDRQAQTLTEGFQQGFRAMAQQLAPQGTKEEEEPIKAPSHEQLRTALEEGDWDRYTQLAAQRENAIYQASVREADKRVNAFRSEGQQWMEKTNRQIIGTAVPDYKKYQEDVEALAEQLGIDAVSRTSPEVVEMLTSTVRGRPENIEKEFAARLEAQKRQANGDGTTSDVASVGRTLPGERSDRAPVFSQEALRALEVAGRTGDEMAKKIGYESFAEYEKAAVALDNDERVVPKWRRAKGVKR